MRTPIRAMRSIVFGLAALLVVAAANRTTLASFDASAPVVTGVMPTAPGSSPTPQRMTINGRDFQPRLELTVRTPEGGTLQFKDRAIQARTDVSFQVDMQLATSGSYSFGVTNPDGGISQPFVLNVLPPRPPIPAIERILPDDIKRNPESQDIRVQGQNFVAGMRAIVTDPAGVQVVGPTIRELTATAFTLNVKLEAAGAYTLMVRNPSGAASNIATIVVRLAAGATVRR